MNRSWVRASGFFGVLGGLTLFVGDMLFYYDPKSTDLLKNMAGASDSRIIASGVSALLASWFYLLGLGQLHHAFRPSPAAVRNVVLASFAAIFVAYGVVHGAYVAIATSAILAAQNNLDLAESTRLASQTNQTLRLVVYPILALLSVLFVVQVWRRQTRYPRWMILFFPAVPFLFQGMVGELLSGEARVVIMGGYLNLILVVFFAASTIALWNSDCSPKTPNTRAR